MIFLCFVGGVLEEMHYWAKEYRNWRYERKKRENN